VMFINPAVDEASRAAKVVAEVPNADDALKGGLFAKGRIVVSSKADVLQVPRAALLSWNVTGATAEVFVVRGGKVEKRPVRTGQVAGPVVAIEAGLARGDQVVTRGGFALKVGDRVTVADEGV
jgi:RND family efflux transporter MFP subunit